MCVHILKCTHPHTHTHTHLKKYKREPFSVKLIKEGNERERGKIHPKENYQLIK